MGYKKTFRYSTGNPIVDEVGTMNFTGNVIPMVWFKTIRYPNGAPHNNAIHILADIVYWYRVFVFCVCAGWVCVSIPTQAGVITGTHFCLRSS